MSVFLVKYHIDIVAVQLGYSLGLVFQHFELVIFTDPDGYAFVLTGQSMIFQLRV